MKRFISQLFAAAILALGIASAQTTQLVVKAKAGQTTYVEIAQLYADGGDLSSVVKLIGVRSSDYSGGFNDRYLALDEGIPGGWKIFVSSSQSRQEEVLVPGRTDNTLYNNYLAKTYGITIPQGVGVGMYTLKLSIRDSNNGDVVLIPMSVEVVL